jgi:diketogulonate reductase-like aldo/keto reductase
MLGAHCSICSCLLLLFLVAAADVPGQKGEIPQVGLGTATIKGPACVDAVKTALAAGYTMLDTALLYGNQVEVGQGA